MTRIWDLPTRLFHWLLVVLVSFSILSAHLGGNWLDWHMRSGILILGLLVFRVLWGFIGPHHARFANFVRPPSAVLAYVRSLRESDAVAKTAQAGHNPLGALSVIAFIFILLFQASTGLFSNEDSMGSEGPLVKYVSGATSDFITRLHKIDQFVIYTLITLHIAAILFYAFVKRDNLVRPMLTGDKPVTGLVSSRDDWVMRLRAALLLVVVFAATGFLYR